MSTDERREDFDDAPILCDCGGYVAPDEATQVDGEWLCVPCAEVAGLCSTCARLEVEV